MGISREQEAIGRYMRRHELMSFAPMAALIDMDGTLYDSMPRHAEAWFRLMREHGIGCTREEFFGYEGQTGRDTIRHLIRRELGREASDEECEALYRLKTQYFSELPDVAPMRGADRMVAELLRRNIVTVLVTGSGQRSLIERLDRDFPGAFPAERQVTSRDVVHGKPHPEPYLRGMDIAGVLPENSLVVDNAPLGVESGAASGAFTIGVTTGPIPAGDLERAGADIVYSSMDELADRLPGLLDGFAMSI